jgi:ABC-type phosphate transport system permease subunit
MFFKTRKKLKGEAKNLAITTKKTTQKTIIMGLTVALIFVLIGVFILSNSMETLDKQAEQLGTEEKPIFKPPFADYNIPGLDNVWGGLIVGVMGTLLLFVISLAVARLLPKKKG